MAVETPTDCQSEHFSIHAISWIRDFASTYNKKFYRISKQGPGSHDCMCSTPRYPQYITQLLRVIHFVLSWLITCHIKIASTRMISWHLYNVTAITTEMYIAKRNHWTCQKLQQTYSTTQQTMGTVYAYYRAICSTKAIIVCLLLLLPCDFVYLLFAGFTS